MNRLAVQDLSGLRDDVPALVPPVPVLTSDPAQLCRIGGVPRRQQLQSLRRRGGGLCDVGGQGDRRLGVQCELLEAEGGLPDLVVVEDLRPGAVDADVVSGPPGAEVLAAGGQLADELTELLVVRRRSGLGAQDLHAGGGGSVEVVVEPGGGGARKTKDAGFGAEASETPVSSPFSIRV